MLIAVLLGFVAALLLPPVFRKLPRIRPFLWCAVPLGLLLYFVSLLGSVARGSIESFSYTWVPSLGVNLSFSADGLALFFAVMITAIGSLVFIYTASYMKGHPHIDRFYAFLSIFMASMLGLVLADGLLLMFVFWELTSISSFFLIGFNNEEAASRKSALTALAITGAGGMGLLAAAVLVVQLVGGDSIALLVEQSGFIAESPLYPLLLAFILLAAFTKSAQFPFHFWLPGAMKAPTPVSTYLHSATMVKAGIFLLLRLEPVLGSTELWSDLLMGFGGLTMLMAAVLSLFKTDMKAILAYTTISALGILTFLIGLGGEAALTAAFVFIFVHALYKACLFLVTGIVDHETGSRDVSELSGLGRVLLPVALAALLAALSSAGVPGSFGFIGKDLIYEATLDAPHWIWLLTGLALLTNVCLLHAGFVVGISPFRGKLPDAYSKVHLPHWSMWLPPVLLAIGCVLLGLFPFLLEKHFIHPALFSLSLEAEPALKLWHGFNTVLLLSGITLLSGVVLYLFLRPGKRLERGLDSLSFLSPEILFLAAARLFQSFSRKWTRLLQNGYLRYYVLAVILLLLVLVGSRMGGALQTKVDFGSLLSLSFYEIATALTLILGITVTVFTQSRLAAVVAMGVVGYAICLFFVFYSAPDLAMTQFTIDTLTVILFVLVLYRLPRYLRLSDRLSRTRDWLLATGFGLMISLVALAAVESKSQRATSEYFSENAYLLAKGKNIVNVILVDFRGSDTLVEITVLAVAAVGVFSLLKLRLKSRKTLR